MDEKIWTKDDEFWFQNPYQLAQKDFICWAQSAIVVMESDIIAWMDQEFERDPKKNLFARAFADAVREDSAFTGGIQIPSGKRVSEIANILKKRYVKKNGVLVRTKNLYDIRFYDTEGKCHGEMYGAESMDEAIAIHTSRHPGTEVANVILDDECGCLCNNFCADFTEVRFSMDNPLRTFDEYKVLMSIRAED